MFTPLLMIQPYLNILPSSASLPQMLVLNLVLLCLQLLTQICRADFRGSGCFIALSFPAWSKCFQGYLSAGDSHLKLDKNVRACKFLKPHVTLDLQHQSFICSLCIVCKNFHNPLDNWSQCLALGLNSILYSIPFHNPLELLHSQLPDLFHLRRVKRSSLNVNGFIFFSPLRFIFQYFRIFIPAATRLRKGLPSTLDEAVELRN